MTESGTCTRSSIASSFLLLLLVGAFPVIAVAQVVGPARGSLVVSGGGETTSHIIDRFIELAGGPDAPIVVVPTSGRNDEDYHEFCPCFRRFHDAGAKNLTVLHTRDRAVANSDAFAGVLREARGVWFNGGSHWLHTDAYLDTRVHEELLALLDRGGVIGGGSAGAHIQGEIMNVSRTPEREFSERKLPREDWRRGFGFLRGVIIDVHVLARNRQFDLIGVLNEHPGMLGIGIDENTAIVVRGDAFEVIGTSYITIHDDQRHIPPDPPETFRTVGGPFYFLRPGDTYDLVTREASRPSRATTPMARVAPRGGGG
ncbi:cyanophycinase [Gemmatimonadota bacterium]